MLFIWLHILLYLCLQLSHSSRMWVRSTTGDVKVCCWAAFLHLHPIFMWSIKVKVVKPWINWFHVGPFLNWFSSLDGLSWLYRLETLSRRTTCLIGQVFWMVLWQMFGIKSTRSLNKIFFYQIRSDHKVDTSDTDGIIHLGLNEFFFF